jgi:hypothetical protein
MAPRPEDQALFLVEEYRALRKEIDQHMIESRTEERYAIISSGVVWAWLILNHEKNALLWLVPVVLSIAIAFRTNAMSKHIEQIGMYIRTLELAFQWVGWEHYEKKRDVTRINLVSAVGLLVLAFIAFFYRKTLAA